MAIICITGIDTNVGKSVAAGWLAKSIASSGKSVITAKLVQTGGSGVSEDILLHRQIMGIDLTEHDKQGTTCPYVFKFPGSPHLAARLENAVIDIAQIISCLKKLEEDFDLVLVEGAGGLMVPLTPNYTFLDFVREHHFPVIVVSSGKLGSINHTLLTLNVLERNAVSLHAVIYNRHFQENKMIEEDSFELIKNSALAFDDNKPVIIDMPSFTNRFGPILNLKELLLRIAEGS